MKTLKELGYKKKTYEHWGRKNETAETFLKEVYNEDEITTERDTLIGITEDGVMLSEDIFTKELGTIHQTIVLSLEEILAIAEEIKRWQDDKV